MRRPLPPGALGPGTRLREIWQRYRIPVAVTEVHHGASRDEQLRWLVGSWQSLHGLAAEGVALRGVTVGALFGLMDWCSLLRQDGHFKPAARARNSAIGLDRAPQDASVDGVWEA